MEPLKILVSAGEASGDRYTAGVVRALRELLPDSEFFGSAGAEMRAAGVRSTFDAERLSVVGLAEVIHHIPRIYSDYRRLLAAAERERPALAILTDSPDFHLRVAARLKRLAIPVFYLVAPQAWAWRESRVRQLARNVRELHCIFPFEEDFFRARGVNARYIGHPLSRIVRPARGREGFFRAHGLPEDRPLITLCPGSRKGEISRHLPLLHDAVRRIAAARPASFVLAAPRGAGVTGTILDDGTVRYLEGETWDAMAHSTVTLAASGTVTIEAALLGAPMVTYYRVTPLSWLVGRPLVRVPFLSMVNLVAGRRIVPELMQNDMTGPRIAAEALRLLDSEEDVRRMREDLAQVRAALEARNDPFRESAARIRAFLEETRS